MDRSSWARRVLIGLFFGHAIALALAVFTGGFDFSRDYLIAALAILNTAGLFGVISRTRWGWFVAMLFVAAAVGRYTWTLGLDGGSGLLLIVGIAAAILCVTDPHLRRDHGMPA